LLSFLTQGNETSWMSQNAYLRDSDPPLLADKEDFYHRIRVPDLERMVQNSSRVEERK
jgi:hypothetical protein